MMPHQAAIPKYNGRHRVSANKQLMLLQKQQADAKLALLKRANVSAAPASSLKNLPKNLTHNGVNLYSGYSSFSNIWVSTVNSTSQYFNSVNIPSVITSICNSLTTTVGGSYAGQTKVELEDGSIIEYDYQENKWRYAYQNIDTTRLKFKPNSIYYLPRGDILYIDKNGRLEIERLKHAKEKLIDVTSPYDKTNKTKAHTLYETMTYCNFRKIPIPEDTGVEFALPNGTTITITEDGEYEIKDKAVRIRKRFDQKLNQGNIELPDGTVVSVNYNGSWRIIDDNATVLYRSNPARDFNRYINASDLLEEFIKYVGTQGVKSKEFMDLPINLFITWLIIQAAKQDGDDPGDEVPLLESSVAKIIEPQCCLHCHQPLSSHLSDLRVQFCSGEHMDYYIEKVNEQKRNNIEEKV